MGPFRSPPVKVINNCQINLVENFSNLMLLLDIQLIGASLGEHVGGVIQYSQALLVETWVGLKN